MASSDGQALAADPPAKAVATPALRDALEPAAREHFDEATRLFKLQKFSDSRVLFIAAHTASDDPRVLYNVAVCDKEMGRYARAISTLRQSLTTASKPLPPEYVRKVVDTIGALTPFVATLTVELSEPSATLRVDGEVVRDRELPVDAGAHVLTATKDGFETTTTTFEAVAGERQAVTLSLRPIAEKGRVTLRCEKEPRCELRIGDESLGRGPISVARETGSYLVQAYVDGALWAEQRIELVNGASVEVALVGRAPLLAKLRVTSDEARDVVFIDGRRAGPSGVELVVPPGEHRVEVIRNASTQRSVDLVLRENETRDLRLTLEEKRSISPWWFVAGGVVLAGAATTVLAIALQPTTFEGSAAGQLNPGVVTASRPLP